eukprot:jgi/Mesvir1/5348/Mv15437-RA.1
MEEPTPSLLKAFFSSLWILHVPSFTLAISDGVVIPVLPLFGRNIAGGTDDLIAGAVVSGRPLGQMLSDIPCGVVTERLGTWPSVVVGGLVMAVGSFLSSACGNLWLLLAAQVTIGFGFSLFGVARHGLVGDLDARIRGRSVAFMGGFTRAGWTLGPLAGGLMAQRLGLRWPFVLAGIFLVATVFVFSLGYSTSSHGVVHDRHQGEQPVAMGGSRDDGIQGKGKTRYGALYLAWASASALPGRAAKLICRVVKLPCMAASKYAAVSGHEDEPSPLPPKSSRRSTASKPPHGWGDVTAPPAGTGSPGGTSPLPVSTDAVVEPMLGGGTRPSPGEHLVSTCGEHDIVSGAGGHDIDWGVEGGRYTKAGERHGLATHSGEHQRSNSGEHCVQVDGVAAVSTSGGLWEAPSHRRLARWGSSDGDFGSPSTIGQGGEAVDVEAGLTGPTSRGGIAHVAVSQDGGDVLAGSHGSIFGTARGTGEAQNGTHPLGRWEVNAFADASSACVAPRVPGTDDAAALPDASRYAGSDASKCSEGDANVAGATPGRTAGDQVTDNAMKTNGAKTTSDVDYGTVNRISPRGLKSGSNGGRLRDTDAAAFTRGNVQGDSIINGPSDNTSTLASLPNTSVTERPPTLASVLVTYWRQFLYGGVVLALQCLRQSRSFLLPLVATDTLGLTKGQVGLITALMFGVDTAMFYPAGYCTDRFGRKPTGVAAMIVLSGGISMLGFARDVRAALLASIIVGLGNGLSGGMMITMGADFAPRGKGRVIFLGVWRCLSSVGAVIGPLVAGMLARQLSLGLAAWCIGAFGMAVSFLWVLFVPESQANYVVLK